jgi:hypothetical protein
MYRYFRAQLQFGDISFKLSRVAIISPRDIDFHPHSSDSTRVRDRFLFTEDVKEANDISIHCVHVEITPRSRSIQMRIAWRATRTHRIRFFSPLIRSLRSLFILSNQLAVCAALARIRATILSHTCPHINDFGATCFASRQA